MRDMIDSPYLYSQLPSHGYIRQLHLASGRDDEPLVCSLHAVLVDEAPAFETISYTWGVPIKSHSILCEGKAIPITANLSHALHQVRLPDKPRILWADSICINQGNLEEQAHQVAFMGEVYTKAWRTLICLDDSAGDLQHSAIAAVLIRDVNEMVARVQSQQDFTWKSDCYPTTDQDDPVISDSRWPSLGVLLQQKWFTRCWVVQEVALSKEARILWAGQNIEWRDLLRVYYWINYRAPRILDVPGVFLSKLHARMFEVYWEKEAITFSSELQFKSPSFLKILDWERALKVSDPRDRIYAFLGLPACRGLALQLSYTRPYLQIYQEFAEEYIKKISDLDILHAAHHNENSIRDPIPSWVPRWDILVYHIDCFHLSWEKITPRENTSPICVSLEDGLLEVRGVEIGQLVFASQRFDTTTSTMQDVSSLWSEVSSFTEDCYTYPRIRAFIRTLRLGLYGGGWHEWTSHEDFYERYLQNQTPLQDQEASDPLVPSTLFRYAHNRKLVLIDKGVYGLAPGIVAKGDVCSIIYGTRTAFVLRPTTHKDVFTLLGAIFILSPNLKDNNQSQRLQMADWREWGREKTIRIA